MKMTIRFLKLPALILALTSTIAFTSCNKDEDSDSGKASIYVTDAPIDDANVKAVFVTVADLKIDGNSVEGFNKQTIEISAYQNGKTELLYDDELEANQYSEITLVLDYETDAEGNSPGSYVVTSDNEKKMISNSSSGSGEFTAAYDLQIESEGSSSVVLDFDLRKAVQKEEGSDEYTLIAESKAEVAIRASDKNESSTVAGSTSDKSTLGMDGQVVVYLYEKGSFSESSETSGDIMFEGAVTSTMVQENGDYTLSFVNDGEYELHMANFKDTDNDGSSEFMGMVNLTLTLGVDLGVITVDSDTNIDLEILGLL